MHVHWLADRDHGETETTVFNVTEFPPNRWHELHRHPRAEEYFYVLEGEGLHLTDGEPIRLRKGDLAFIPRGEWHGFANDSNDPTLAVTVMGGVAHGRRRTLQRRRLRGAHHSAAAKTGHQEDLPPLLTTLVGNAVGDVPARWRQAKFS